MNNRSPRVSERRNRIAAFTFDCPANREHHRSDNSIRRLLERGLLFLSIEPFAVKIVMVFTLILAYTTDLTLAQFEVLDELLPASKTRKDFLSKHLTVNAILYQLKNGCQWRDLPTDFPQWQTVYSQCAAVAT